MSVQTFDRTIILGQSSGCGPAHGRPRPVRLAGPTERRAASRRRRLRARRRVEIAELQERSSQSIGVPGIVRAPYRVVEELEPIVQAHSIEGLMMGAKTCYIDTVPTLGFMTELILEEAQPA